MTVHRSGLTTRRDQPRSRRARTKSSTAAVPSPSSVQGCQPSCMAARVGSRALRCELAGPERLEVHPGFDPGAFGHDR